MFVAPSTARLQPLLLPDRTNLEGRRTRREAARPLPRCCSLGFPADSWCLLPPLTLLSSACGSPTRILGHPRGPRAALRLPRVCRGQAWPQLTRSSCVESPVSAPSPLAPDGCLLSSCFFHRWSHCQPLGWGGCLGRSSARHHGWLTEVTCPVQQLPHRRVRDKSCRKADLPSDVLPGIQLLPCSARRTGCSARRWHGHVQPGLCWGGKRRVEAVQHGCVLARRGKKLCNKSFCFVFQEKTAPSPTLHDCSHEIRGERMAAEEEEAEKAPFLQGQQCWHTKRSPRGPGTITLASSLSQQPCHSVLPMQLGQPECTMLEIPVPSDVGQHPRVRRGTQHLGSTTERLSHREDKISLCCFYFSLGRARLQQVLTALLVQTQVYLL